MPQVGDTIKGKDLGYKGTRRYVWTICDRCKEGRWVNTSFLPTARTGFCRHCAISRKREEHPLWVSNRTRTSAGYIEIRLLPNDPFYPMADKRERVKEHRYVMAQSLGRCLQSWELVHHRNGRRDDNRLENLVIVLRRSHWGKVRCPFCNRDFELK